MAKSKRGSYYASPHSYYFGSLLAFVSIGLVVLACLVLISGSKTSHSRLSGHKPLLATSHYQAAAIHEPTAQPPLLPAPSVQPALETWQGPIQPVPIDPNQQLPQAITQISTTEPVVFLGIDDGWVQTPETLAWLTQNRLPFTLFLTDNGIKNNYNYFRLLQAAGMTIEDHTVSHPNLTKLTLAQQQAEICTAADTYSSVFGDRPTLFRPPYGKANLLTFQAAAACGMKAIVMWHALVDKGVIQYQDGDKHLQPGDIVLMHFTPNFLQDMQAFMNQITADHLQVARLEEWIH